jgi:myo-inositol-1(or 4)-monophosphatase
MAAGSLMVSEAGGRVTRWNGDAFAIEGRQVLASNGTLHDEMLAVLAASRDAAL